jgi:hypothetical protein
VAAGLVILLNYENTPGTAGSPVVQWPASSAIQRHAGRATLLMFAHPQCPCTRASIGELALLMAHCQGLVDAHVVFFKPQESGDDWSKTDLWRSAAAIPGVTVGQDDAGAEADRFHAETSGYTLLYDRQGQLRFNGGITAARGHSGDNAGRSAIIGLLRDGLAGTNRTKVFGCSLLNPK